MVLKEIKIEEPFVKPVLIDYFYQGYCSVISFEALKKFMIDKGEMDKNAIDASFISLIFLKGSQVEDFQYNVKFLPENELIGVISPDSHMKIIRPSSFNIFTLDFAFKKRLRKCNPNIQRMTPCVQKSYDEKYGNDYNNHFAKYTHMADATFSGSLTR